METGFQRLRPETCASGTPHLLLLCFHLCQMETSGVDWDWNAMRRWSKPMFRRTNWLPVAVLARHAAAEELYAQSIADRLRIDQPQATDTLRDLIAMGALERNPDVRPPIGPRGGRPGTCYRRVEDPLWHYVETVGRRFLRHVS
jgi:hypothetical protein